MIEPADSGEPLAQPSGMSGWNLVVLDPDSNHWQLVRGMLERMGHRPIAVDSIEGLESVLDAYDVESVLIRPVGDLEDHRRLARRLQRLGTRVFVVADITALRVLSIYYALGDQTRTVRPHPAELAADMIRHARRLVDALPPVPEFGTHVVAANDPPLLTRGAPSKRLEAIDVSRVAVPRPAVASTAL